MDQYQVKQYQNTNYEHWNDFNGQAKNATFLFHRDFMEYHRDRFDDFSLMVYEAEKLVAILPANRVDNLVYSHQGLTYGGLVYREDLRLSTVVNVFQAVLCFLNRTGVDKLQIKMLPTIYHQKPAQELDYVLFLVEAKLIRRDTLSVIDLSQKIAFSKLRNRGIQKAQNNLLQIKEENGFDAFWNQVLIPNLKDRHQAQPVHTIAEMIRLKQLFPENIRQFNVYKGDEIVAGTTIFETNTVAHCQYISKYESEENLGSLDFLYHFLITEKYNKKRFFDFGISNEAKGKKLNEGLSFWKESFGASTVVQDFYEIETANFCLLEKCII